MKALFVIRKYKSFTLEQQYKCEYSIVSCIRKKEVKEVLYNRSKLLIIVTLIEISG